MKWYLVRIKFNNEMGWHYDQILGNSEEQALTRAYWNWEEAEKIELVN